MNLDFFVVGVVKGGTTSLYNYFMQHPNIYLGPIKETNHFSDCDMQYERFEKQYRIDSSLDIEKYLKGKRDMVHIAHVRDENQYFQLYKDAPLNSIKGEICNSYFLSNCAAQTIAKAQPKAKILVVLRNPIKRAYSQYLMNLREAKVLNRSFIEEIEFDYKREFKGWGVSHNYLELGLYSEQLKRYYKHFSKDQILVCFFEDLISKKQNSLDKIFDFLGIAKIEIEDSKAHNSASLPRSKGLNYLLNRFGLIKVAKSIVPREKRQHLKKLLFSSKNLPKINEDERNYLVDFYRDDISELEKMLNLDLQHWLA